MGDVNQGRIVRLSSQILRLTNERWAIHDHIKRLQEFLNAVDTERTRYRNWRDGIVKAAGAQTAPTGILSTPFTPSYSHYVFQPVATVQTPPPSKKAAKGCYNCLHYQSDLCADCNDDFSNWAPQDEDTQGAGIERKLEAPE